MTILTDMQTTIATVVPPTVVEEAAPAETAEAAAVPAAAAEGAEPEVIGRGKKEAEEEGEKKESK